MRLKSCVTWHQYSCKCIPKCSLYSKDSLTIKMFAMPSWWTLPLISLKCSTSPQYWQVYPKLQITFSRNFSAPVFPLSASVCLTLSKTRQWRSWICRGGSGGGGAGESGLEMGKTWDPTDELSSVFLRIKLDMLNCTLNQVLHFFWGYPE